jgi:thiol-disulfide isomerase/thioredoxin
MQIYFIRLILVFIMLFSLKSNAQSFEFEVLFPKNIKSDSLVIAIDNGYGLRLLKNKLFENKLTIKTSCRYRKVFLNVNYKCSGKTQVFAYLLSIRSKRATFEEKNDSSHELVLKQPVANSIDVLNGIENRKLLKYIKYEKGIIDSLERTYNSNQDEQYKKLVYEAKWQKAKKEIEFFKKQTGNYFYLWYFKYNIIQEFADDKKLLIYEEMNDIFKKYKRDSLEILDLKQLLEGKLFVKKGAKSPIIETTDINGSNIRIDSLSTKYSLISFWATWCVPCMEKIPMLKTLNNKYKDSNFQIIALSFDFDSSAFTKGIKKYDMDWIHCYRKKEILNLFGDRPLPSLYLIAPNGTILFSSWEQGLTDLEKILAEKLKSNL